MSTSERLGRYRIVERIGEGGAGEVFRAEMEGAGGFTKTVAIKRVRGRLVRDRAILDDFLREAQIAQNLHHGNVVQIFDVGTADGLPFLVMEHVAGVSLAELIAASRPRGLPAEDALYVIEQVAAALEYAHGLADERGRPAGVIHRDIKPRNVLVSRDGVVKLTDFGIARPLRGPARTTPGVIKGSVGYMAPEQLYGQPIDPRVDQYAAGVVLYEMLCGENPLLEADGVLRYAALLERGLPRLGAAPPVDDALRDIAARATAPDPSRRYSSMAEFRAAVETWRVERGIRGSPDGVRGRVRAALGIADVPPRPDLGAALADRLGDVAARPTVAVAALPPGGARAALSGGSARSTSPRRSWWPRAALVIAVAAGTFGLGAAAAVILWARDGVSARRTDAIAAAARARASEPRTGGGDGPAAERVSEPRTDDTASGARTGGSAGPAPQAFAPRTAGNLAGADRAAEPRAGEGTGSPGAGGEDRAARAHQERGARDQAGDDARAPAAPGRLKINLIPYAAVTVGGRGVGRTPVDLDLPPGEHRVGLDNPETGQQKTLTVRVQSGGTTTITTW